MLDLLFRWDYTNQTIINELDNEEAKSFIRKGIESVRLTGHHVLPLQLLVLLGRTFANKVCIRLFKVDFFVLLLD